MAQNILITVGKIVFEGSTICVRFISEIKEDVSVENKKMNQCRGDFDSDVFTKSLVRFRSSSVFFQSCFTQTTEIL